MTPAKKMDVVNNNYNKWRNKIMQQEFKMMYCPECGAHIWNDNNMIQRHMILNHIKDNPIKKDLGWKITPTNL